MEPDYEKRLYLIAAVVIVAVGVAYMTWLVLSFIEQRRTGDYIRAHVDDLINLDGNTPEPQEAEPVTVPAEVVDDS
jgi:hypothetical protein